MRNRVMRVLFIPWEDFPTDRVRINVLFGSELIGRGHEIDLVMQAADESVAVGPQPWHGRTVWVGPTDCRDGFLHRLRRTWLSVAHDIRCLRRAQRERYDAVLVSDKFFTAALAAVLAKARGLRFIFWLTFPYPEADLYRVRLGVARYPTLATLRGRLGAWLLYRWILPRSDHVFVQSDRMKHDVCARGADAAKVSSILTGFDLTGIAPAARPAQRAAAAPVVVAYLGTLNAMRRLDVLVDMLAELRRGGMDARLLLVGGSPNPRDRRLLEARAAELTLTPYVELTGALPQADALRRIAAADVCISPIDRSPILDVGSPTKMIEYLALGMPVVANDHPEQRFILRATRSGVCVPWGARHYARAVRWLMSRRPEERAAMGARGRAWVEQHRTYARIADEVERVCLDVIARPSYAVGRSESMRPAARVDRP
jgi:glycosyltransferase involved in cell wall biosynthesis